MSTRSTRSGRSLPAVLFALLAICVVGIGCTGCASSDMNGWAQTGPRLAPATSDGERVTLGARADETE